MARSRWFSLLSDVVRALVRPGTRGGGTPSRTAPRPSPRPAPRGGAARPGGGARAAAGGTTTAYVGDFTGTVRPRYAPKPDGAPDPGEVVWTWVPFEDDPTQGKDRPVLLVGRDGRWLLALMLTSKDHDRDAAQEARWGRRWMDVGAGAWDRQGRPSEVRLDRVVRVDPAAVRREGAVMGRALFDRVVTASAQSRSGRG